MTMSTQMRRWRIALAWGCKLDDNVAIGGAAKLAVLVACKQIAWFAAPKWRDEIVRTTSMLRRDLLYTSFRLDVLHGYGACYIAEIFGNLNDR